MFVILLFFMSILIVCRNWHVLVFVNCNILPTITSTHDNCGTKAQNSKVIKKVVISKKPPVLVCIDNFKTLVHSFTPAKINCGSKL